MGYFSKLKEKRKRKRDYKDFFAAYSAGKYIYGILPGIIFKDEGEKKWKYEGPCPNHTPRELLVFESEKKYAIPFLSISENLDKICAVYTCLDENNSFTGEIKHNFHNLKIGKKIGWNYPEWYKNPQRLEELIVKEAA
ncbi:MAG TPA: hypothetical protein VJB11_02215 [archaeon]|nr:hypothetical protein [archaeon]